MSLTKFGIELRKVGSLGGLYKDIDRVLSSFNIPTKGVNRNVQATAVAHSLQKMISVESHFSVCTIDSCAKLCQICIPEERYRLYNTQHCIRWQEMTEEFRQALVAMVLDDFRPVLNPEEGII